MNRGDSVKTRGSEWVAPDFSAAQCAPFRTQPKRNLPGGEGGGRIVWLCSIHNKLYIMYRVHKACVAQLTKQLFQLLVSLRVVVTMWRSCMA